MKWRERFKHGKIFRPEAELVCKLPQGGDDVNALMFTGVNQLNLEREKAGLQHEPVITFDQWRVKKPANQAT